MGILLFAARSYTIADQSVDGAGGEFDCPAAPRFKAAKGVLITGESGQFVSKDFGFPARRSRAARQRRDAGLAPLTRPS